MKKILFVCTGNTCRSPMAEAMTVHRMPEAWKGAFAVSSAGTAACDGLKAASNAIKVLEEIGIDLSGHRTRSLTREMLEEADLVVALTGGHKEEILRRFSGSRGRVIVLGELEGRRGNPDIADPIGGDEEAYRVTREEISRLVPRLFDYLIEMYNITK